ncbi:DUF2218 domain-containing protein [Methylophaga thiooxydans]|uniref:DUF2218 domain-containing protein n=1 Tax=Methylophaga thiooxydans TaxID=392484 RepID=UPI002352227A|nr:DUF2218 domain-containing protein [Methylophaga thiooxydans]
MVEKNAVIMTTQADRFVRMLCKHFSHKVNADWGDEQGWVEFAMGRCELSAEPQQLLVRCHADNETDLEVVTDTIKSHFDRFAQKQQLTLNWR